jgi:hypothetical protein
MYNVSDAYKAAMAQPVQRFRLRGTLQIGARSIAYTQENIVRGSFQYSTQCSGSDNVEIGTVYVGELDATLIGLAIPRGNLSGAKFTPKLGLLTTDGWEDVPLGVFYINEANWTTYGLEITTYDGMSLLDKTISLASSIGTIYDFLYAAALACGLELGQTRAEIQEGFANATASLSVYEENDIKTWRDLVAWCAQTAGAFATVDREGRLILKKYTTDPVDTIDAEHRLTGAKFSDFVTRYTGVSVVSSADKVTKYYGLQPDDGLTYNLGQNPLLQYGLEETKEAYARAILSFLAVIRYTPMEVSLIGNPAYDIGDAIAFTGGAAGEDGALSCITAIEWTYGDEYRITGVGQNPALMSAKSKVDKDIAGLLSEANQDAIHYYDYLNVKEIHIGDGERGEIIRFRYATTKVTHVDFHAEVHYTLETTEGDEDDLYTEHDGVIRVTYILNGEEVTLYHPVETKTDGEHLLHLLFTWSATANVVGDFVVYVDMLGASIDIGIAQSRAYIAGQGLVGDGEWDGTVSASDDVPPLDLSYVLPGFTDSLQIDRADVLSAGGITEKFRSLDMTYVLGSFTATLGDSKMLHRFSVAYNAAEMTYDGVTVDGSLWRLEEGKATGSLTTPAKPVERILRVTSAHSGDDVAYIVSFDGGTTWWTYAAGWAEPDYTQDVYGMFEGTMRSITEAQWAEKLSGSIMVRAILTNEATVTDIQIYTEDIKR